MLQVTLRGDATTLNRTAYASTGSRRVEVSVVQNVRGGRRSAQARVSWARNDGSGWSSGSVTRPTLESAARLAAERFEALTAWAVAS